MIGFLPVDPLTYQSAREARREATKSNATQEEKSTEQENKDHNSSNEQTV